jgi:ParB/RepB/Spo0J family partition protein
MPRKAAPLPDISFITGAPPEVNRATLFAGGASDLPPAQPIKIELLENNPYQPRDASDPEALAELSAVIAAQGFQGALVARPDPKQAGRYQIAFGHRRREAARAAGLSTVPVMVRDLTDEEMVESAVSENIRREDLTPLMEARTFGLMEKELGYTHEQIAQAIGKKRGYIENRLRLLRAPADVQALVAEKPDTIRAVANLIKVRDPAVRAELIAGLRAGTLKTDDLPGLVEERLAPAAPPAPASAPASRRRAGTPDEPQERASARVGRGKLANAIRTLRTYRELALDRTVLSIEEYAALSELRELLDALFTEHPAELPAGAQASE